MAYYDITWYANSVGYTAVTAWAATTAVVAGALRRQLTAPAVNSERVFVCIVAGTTGGTEPTWVLTRGAKTTDGTVTWMECTGIAALNSDITNTVKWTAAKAIGTPSLGTIIQRNSGASYQICTTAGTLGAAEPSFSDTAGVTTTETSATTVWTSLGAVGNFTGGQAPHARLTAVFGTNWWVAPNTVYVGNNHAESQSTTINITPSSSGSASVTGILCHNHSGSYPPATGDLTTGATITSTVGVGNINFNPSPGSFYVYGITFAAGNASSTICALVFSGGNAVVYFDKCSMRLGATGNNINNVIQVGSGNAIIFNNTTVSFGNAVQAIDIETVNFTWQNTGQILVTGSAVPNFLLAPVANAHAAVVTLEALDLSQITTSLASTATNFGSWFIKDCKLNASAIVTTPGFSGVTVQLVRCDSGATGYKSSRYQFEGTETTETSITRVGGAADPTGQVQSRKIVTTANLQWLKPFKAEPYAIWNAVTGATVTVTICGTINAGALPNNDDIWIEVEYLGSSATPLGTIVNTTKANLLAANAAVASDSSTWNNVSFASLDPTTTTNTTLSNNNLTATHSNSATNSGVRNQSYQSTGKYYFEVTAVTTTGYSNMAGILLSTGTYANLVGSGFNCWAVGFGGGTIFNNNTSNTGPGTVANGNVLSFAFDLTAQLGWVRKNGGIWNNSGTANPATGVGGLPIAAGSFAPVIGFDTGSGDVMTANFGATTYAYTPPSGFGSWPAGYTPFKLTATLSSPQPGLPGYIHVRPKVAKPSATFYLDPQITLS